MKTIVKFLLIIIVLLNIYERSVAQLKVQGTQLKDACGNLIQLVGVNKMNIFLDRSGSSMTAIATTGANCVRIVWAAKYPIQVNNETVFEGTPTSASELESIISQCTANKMIAIIEAHDATTAWSKREKVMALWERSDIVDLIKKYETQIIVNIGNEIGGEYDVNGQHIKDNPNENEFVTWYTTVIQRIRNKGIKVPLMIDSISGGRDMEFIGKVATRLLAIDPNLIFSVHTYWSDYDIQTSSSGTKTPQQFITDQFQFVKNFPIIIGELANSGGFAGTGSTCSPNATISYNLIAKESLKSTIGYVAWEWGPGNDGGGDPLCKKMNMTQDSKNLDGWGLDIVNNTDYGIKANAKKIPYFYTDCLCENVTLGISTVTQTSGNRQLTQQLFSWYSSSNSIQSYVMEIEQNRLPPQTSVNKSVPISYVQSSTNPRFLPKHQQYSVGIRDKAKLKVFRKDGSTCYVTPR